jgi:hypothetical protein
MSRRLAAILADVVTAGDLDQLGNPADPSDQRLVPLLKEDARSGASMLLLARDHLESPSQGVRQRVGGIAAIDQRPEGADHREDAGHVALVEQMDGEAGAGKVLDDSGLEIGGSKDQAGDLRRVGRGERRDPRLLAPDPRRPNGIARDPDDPSPRR